MIITNDATKVDKLIDDYNAMSIKAGRNSAVLVKLTALVLLVFISGST